MKHAPCLLFLLVGIVRGAFAQHQVVVVSELAKNNNEPSIAVDPQNALVQVIGTNLNTVYRSEDGGATWQGTDIKSSYGVYGDPVVLIDKKSQTHFIHLSNGEGLSWLDRIVVQRADSGSMLFSDGTYTGLNDKKVQDKPWVGYDLPNNRLYLTWTEFDGYQSTDPGDSTRIRFSSSFNGGESWSSARTISHVSGTCMDNDSTAEGAVPAIGPKGEIYVAWALNDTIRFNRSTDGGSTWLSSERKIATQPNGWRVEIPGVYRANGLPFTACQTGKAYNGRIYVNYTAQPDPDDTDVFLIWSDDGGDTWSDPKRVNDDTGRHHQFFSSMLVDSLTGAVWICFYDRRNAGKDSLQTEVFLALSMDGGETFYQEAISDKPFKSKKDVFMGDYTHIAGAGAVVRPVWTYFDGEQTGIKTALINVPHFTRKLIPSGSPHYIYEVPPVLKAGGFLTISSSKYAKLSLEIWNTERKVSTLVHEMYYTPGEHPVRILAESLPGKSGQYTLKLCDEQGECEQTQVLVRR